MEKIVDIKVEGAVLKGKIDNYGFNFERVIAKEYVTGSINVKMLKDLISELQEVVDILEKLNN